MNSPPRVSVLIPTYQRPRLLARAISSALDQTVRDLEVLVFDNASADDTASVVNAIASADERVRFFTSDHNLGGFSNFDRAMRAVRTEYFSFLADDDRLVANFCEVAVRALEQDPEALFVVTQVIDCDSDDRAMIRPFMQLAPGSYEPPAGLRAMLEGRHPNWTGILFRRRVMERVGYLDPKTSPYFDLDYQLRAAARVPFCVLSGYGAIYCLHQGSMQGSGQLGEIPSAMRCIRRNVAVDPMLSVDLRNEAVEALHRLFSHALFRLALGLSRRGELKEAHRAARALRSDYGSYLPSLIVDAAAVLCALLPPVRKALARRAVRRRPYVRRGHETLTVSDLLRENRLGPTDDAG
jgi:glycosyltransferase involved in cell wall biosynthesis